VEAVNRAVAGSGVGRRHRWNGTETRLDVRGLGVSKGRGLSFGHERPGGGPLAKQLRALQARVMTEPDVKHSSIVKENCSDDRLYDTVCVASSPKRGSAAPSGSQITNCDGGKLCEYGTLALENKAATLLSCSVYIKAF